jgi:hypothetical protein
METENFAVRGLKTLIRVSHGFFAQNLESVADCME